MSEIVTSPKISVIIPTFNAVKYLPLAIESVLSQTFKSIEVIVVDDGSTDDTNVVVKKYPVKYTKIEHSGGPASPRNVGVRRAKGKLIAFLDDDDVWLPKKLEEQAKFMQEGKFDLIHCDGEVIDETENAVRESFHLGLEVPSGEVFAYLYRQNFIATSSVLVKKECFDKVGDFDPSLTFEDYDLWLRMAQRFSMGYLDKKLFLYREKQSSYSERGVLENHENLIAVLRKNYYFAKKVLGGEAKLKLYDLSKFLTSTSKGSYPLKYLKYKLLCLAFFPPLELKRRDISLIEEVKGLIRL